MVVLNTGHGPKHELSSKRLPLTRLFPGHWPDFWSVSCSVILCSQLHILWLRLGMWRIPNPMESDTFSEIRQIL